jgi:hypothetical protein
VRAGVDIFLDHEEVFKIGLAIISVDVGNVYWIEGDLSPK